MTPSPTPATRRTTHDDQEVAMPDTPAQTQDPPEAEERTVKPFAQFLREQRKGAAHDEASTEFNKLVEACMETRKKGTFTLKVTIAPQPDGETLLVDDDIVVKAPKYPQDPSRFFADGDHNLQRNDPRQLEIGPLKEIPGGKTDGEHKTLKEVPAR